MPRRARALRGAARGARARPSRDRIALVENQEAARRHRRGPPAHPARERRARPRRRVRPSHPRGGVGATGVLRPLVERGRPKRAGPVDDRPALRADSAKRTAGRHPEALVIARVASCVGMVLLVLPAEASRWPAILPMKETFRIESAAGPVSIEIPILTPSRAMAYMLFCRSDAHEPSEGVPSFLCTLNEKAGEMESTFLGEDGSPAWHTRGQYHMQELLGECASYPEYGAHRTFRLRGLRLELTAADVKQGPGRVESLAFTVAVRSDPSAVLAQAAQPGFLHPKGQCRPIRRGNGPRMCRDFRDLGGSWTQCTKIGR